MKKEDSPIKILTGVEELLNLDKNPYDMRWPVFSISTLPVDLHKILNTDNAVVVFTSKSSFYALKENYHKDLERLFKKENAITIATVGEFTKSYITSFFKNSSLLTPKERGLQSFFNDYYNAYDEYFILTGKNSKSLGECHKKKNVHVFEVYELIETRFDFKALLESHGKSYHNGIDFIFVCKSKDILVQVLKVLSLNLKCSINSFPENIYFELWEKSAKDYAESIGLKFCDYR